jgi:hypothetical protein
MGRVPQAKAIRFGTPKRRLAASERSARPCTETNEARECILLCGLKRGEKVGGSCFENCGGGFRSEWEWHGWETMPHLRERDHPALQVHATITRLNRADDAAPGHRLVRSCVHHAACALADQNACLLEYRLH